MKKITKSSIKCNHCGTVLISKYRHDFVTCECKKVSLDGGLYHQSINFNEMHDFVNISEFEHVIELENGKYKMIVDDDGRYIKALLHDEEWRNFTGDKLMYNLLFRLLEAEQALEKVNKICKNTIKE